MKSNPLLLGNIYPETIVTNPEFHPRKHTVMTYRAQQRNAKKLRRIRAKQTK
ncbi:MAG: hypothetical protein GYA62_01165 [Bacteroidales bacterium]|nr:hypothetical protein [Bacteroidales bacterium]